MKTWIKKKLMICMALLLVFLAACPAGLTKAEASDQLEAKTYPYFQRLDDKKEITEGEMTLYFLNGGDIPYVKLSEYMAFLSRLFKEMDKGEIAYKISAAGEPAGLFSVTRDDNDSYMIFNTEEDSIISSGSNFLNNADVTALVTVIDLPEPETMDIAAMMAKAQEMQASGQYTTEEITAAITGKADDGKPQMFTSSFKSFNQFGGVAKIPLADYCIDMISQDGECFIPMQTMNDLLLGPEYFHLVFNGEKVIGAAFGTEFIKQMYTASPRQMSPEFAKFNFNELMLLLDTQYGLKEEHHIRSFLDTVIFNSDLNALLANTDPKAFDAALTTLLMTYLDDGHSAFANASWMSGETDPIEMMSMISSVGRSSRSKIKGSHIFEEARKRFYPDGVPGYEEIGDTAFITFDSFTMEYEERDKYYQLESIDPAKDTIQLISYANQQIRREGSPVRNIVLDLSLNGGGAADAAVFVASWMAGNAAIALRDTMTNSETITSFYADVNLDGNSDNDVKDTVADGNYRLFCLISDNSFSCGNLVPAALKTAGNVTLIGQRSGGGSCVVLPCTTASGAVFMMSGTKQLATVRNGSFYNIDEGIEPDFVLSRPESFYDRPALAEYIKNLK